MADFPTSYCISRQGYEIRPLTGREVIRADSGKPRIRDLWGETRYAIQFTLFPLTNEQVSDVRDFYNANKDSEVVWRDPWDDDQPYTALMLDEPVVIGLEGRYARLQVTMEGRRGE